MKKNPADIHFRKPEVSDAPSIERLVRFSPPLDVNSLYCYLIICAVTVLPTHIVFDNRLRYDSAVGGKCRHGSLKI